MTPRILVVDDDQDHAESVADILLLRNYQVEIALSGEDAIQRFRQTDFDITLMDVRLPGIDGMQTFFEFRRLRPSAQVIMMTGFSVEKLISDALNGGAVGVLHKPFAASELLNTLEAVKPRGLVMVADDDPEFRQNTTDLLSRTGYKVEIARNGDEAATTLRSTDCDCLIMDLELPLLSAIEVLRGLNGSSRMVPIILLVPSLANQMDIPRSLIAERVLIKPFDPAILLAAVADIVETRHASAA
jgi:two-component system, NtrC family, response regulator HydG